MAPCDQRQQVGVPCCEVAPGIPVKLPRAQSAANLHEVLIAGEVQGAVPGGNPLITCRR